MTTTAVKAHPALIGETTDLFIAILREYRRAKAGTIARSYWADQLAGAASGGFSDSASPGAEIGEALQWLGRARAGDSEARVVVDSIPRWHDREDDYVDAINDHADSLRDLPLYAKGHEPGAAPEHGRRKAGGTKLPDGLEHVEQHADKLPRAWEPRVKEGSATALAWECLTVLHGESKGPVPDRTWKDRYLSDFLPATFADGEAAFRDAKRNLKGQKALRESAEGWSPRLTA
jgi:hypothetical protein